MKKWEPVFVQSRKTSTQRTIFLALMGLLGILTSSCRPIVPPIAPPVETGYVGRIIDTITHAPVIGAEVTLDLQGVPPTVYTDAVGIYRFRVAIHSNISGQIRVNAKGYQVYIRNITISPDNNAIEDIRLTPQSIPISTFTPLPDSTAIPTSTLQVQTFTDGCIFSETWKVHSLDASTVNSISTKPNGCYDMGAVGIFTGNTNVLHILDKNKKVPVVSGIYTPINNDSAIEFKVFVNSMYIADGSSPLFASFAVASASDPLSAKNTARFKLQVDTNKVKPPPIIFVLADAGENNGAAIEGRHYGYGNTYTIRLELTGGVMNVYINSIKMNEMLTVPVGPKVFYIGYNLPAHAGMDVIVSELKIDGVLK